MLWSPNARAQADKIRPVRLNETRQIPHKWRAERAKNSFDTWPKNSQHAAMVIDLTKPSLQPKLWHSIALAQRPIYHRETPLSAFSLFAHHPQRSHVIARKFRALDCRIKRHKPRFGLSFSVKITYVRAAAQNLGGQLHGPCWTTSRPAPSQIAIKRRPRCRLQ